MNKVIKWILLLLGLITIALCGYWIYTDNPKVEPWTIAIGAIIFIIGIFWPNQSESKNKQSVLFGNQNKQEISNNSKETEQSIIGGDSNVQVIGNNNVVNQANKQAPRLNVSIKTLGASSQGLSPTMQIGGTGDKLFKWDYDIKLKNESLNYAHDVTVSYPKGNKFNTNDFEGNLGTIAPGASLEKNATFELTSNVSGYLMTKLREEKYPDGIRDFTVHIDYKDADGNSYTEELKIDSNGQES